MSRSSRASHNIISASDLVVNSPVDASAVKIPPVILDCLMKRSKYHALQEKLTQLALDCGIKTLKSKSAAGTISSWKMQVFLTPSEACQINERPVSTAAH